MSSHRVHRFVQRERRWPGGVRVLAQTCLAITLGALPRGAAVAQSTTDETSVGEVESSDVATPLAGTIDALLERRFLQDAQVSIHVLDLERDAVLYEKNPGLALNPASNVKLLTTAAALSLLGPSHRYETELRGRKPRDGVIEGDIFLVGGGDPSLLTGDLYELASRLRAMGVREITGGVMVDATLFGDDLAPPGYDQKEEFAAYRAPIGAASVNFNTFELRVGPGKLGRPAQISVRPPVPSVAVGNETKTVKGTRRRVRVRPEQSNDTTTRVRVSGTIGADGRRALYRYPVVSPAAHAGEVLALTLAQAGITLGREGAGRGAAPPRSDVLAVHRSEPLGMIIRAVNKLSSNFMAELIVHGLDEDRPVKAQGGLDRVRDWAAQTQLLEGDAWVGNGSGLYDNNRMASSQLTSLLRTVHDDFRIYGDFLASLAIMGTDGTTRRRLDDTEHAGWIRAKTGTLDGISALSGYAAVEGRRPVAFSILFNDIPLGSTAIARRTQDEIAGAIHAWIASTMRAPSPASISP